MLRKKTLAVVTIVVWYLTLGVIFGPVRLEFSHTYRHWIEGLEESLPSLTRAFAVPILGLDLPGLSGGWVFFAVWGILWIFPAALAVCIIRARDEQAVLSRWVLGASLHSTVTLLITVLVAFGLWLPFALV